MAHKIINLSWVGLVASYCVSGQWGLSVFVVSKANNWFLAQGICPHQRIQLALHDVDAFEGAVAVLAFRFQP
jgi:hypothetical protein